ncbi:transglutaminase family protein [Alkalicoccobacillus murimartini]|uniref:Transglutaminase-like putative cysteine protease n=1 Tax=Alkalicoccobacillus murimartini TaxID=171685 RepID=A0ABT9YJR7_9BACI|nr:transglutaminase family protein [Alkalicoccobacillus murimartini]MDQ0207766.1 transglutaminase-like putative cysteine protease [Alkalicoccobacillus murimartini]
MKFEIVHTNLFTYDSSVEQSLNTIRLKPRMDECQRLISYRADITPSSLTSSHIDLWGNHVETFFIAEQHQSLEVKTTSIVSIQRSPFINKLDYSLEMQKIFISSIFQDQYLAFLTQTNYTFLSYDQINQVTQDIGPMNNPIQFSLDLMDYLFRTFHYQPGSTDVNTTASDAFNQKNGVCQDITHVMIGILRAHQIPARYISGYLYVGQDSALIGDAASHAWVEIMAPGIGWIGLDPTNNVEALENHVRVCTGRDYADVSPVQGVYKGGNQKLTVSVSVTLLES